jgi:Rad3-related DNA helicase
LTKNKKCGIIKARLIEYIIEVIIMLMSKGEFLKKFPYETIRREQKYVLEKIYENYHKYDYFVIEAPTGTGKSAIAKTLLDNVKYGAVLTSTKHLQNQYETEFDNMPSVKGKSNYECFYGDGYIRCDKAPCKINSGLKRDCMNGCLCEYENKVRLIRENSFVSSYSFFLSNKQYFTEAKKTKNHLDMIILDECHLLENNLISDVGFSINVLNLNDEFDILADLPVNEFIIATAPFKNGFEENKDALVIISNALARRNRYYTEILEDEKFRKLDINNLTVKEIKEYQELVDKQERVDKILSKLNYFLYAKDKENWVVEPNEDILYIQPINIGNYFNSRINKYADKVVFLSATILDLDGFVEDLNIDKDRVFKIRIPSTFNFKNSPIVYIPCGSMSYKNIDNSIPNVVKEIKRILKEHKGEKGIIHTNNYRITEEIIKQVNDKRLIYCDKNNKLNNEELLKMHEQSKRDTVLISPSLSTGVDLKDDLSRFQIIIKLPFLSLGDRRVNKKSQVNRNWYTVEMLRGLMQMCGRSTRHANDYCVTYILDNAFWTYAYNYAKFLGKSFLQRCIMDKNNFHLDRWKEYVERNNK